MTANNNNNKLSPIEKLKQDKRRLKKAYLEDGERLQQNWDYMSHNIGSIFFNTAFRSSKSSYGDEADENQEASSDFGLMSLLGKGSGMSLINIFTSALPVVWKVAQPMLIGIAVKKIKNMFFGSKKK